MTYELKLMISILKVNKNALDNIQDIEGMLTNLIRWQAQSSFKYTYSTKYVIYINIIIVFFLQ
jgi:hypothetical protein